MIKITQSKSITTLFWFLALLSNPAWALAEFDINFSGLVAPAIGVDSVPYRGAESEPYGAVLVMGRIGDLFIEGNRLGYLFDRTDYGALSLVGQIRSHQYLPDEVFQGDEDKAFELGLQVAKPIGLGWVGQLSTFSDVSDTHNGHEIELGAYRRDFFGDLRLLTLVALQQQSRTLTSHYAETPDYKPSSGDLNLELELIAVYPITENVSALGVFRHYVHGDGLADSPLTDGRETSRLLLGIGWQF